MLNQFFPIAIIVLLGAMLPGPDFAFVVKNTLMYSRRSGIFTSLGIATAALVHITYCALGLAIVISKSLVLFTIIKYIGAAYLIYLGVQSLLAKQSKHLIDPLKHKKSKISAYASFRKGFLCNLLNPKATLFFLALFTMIIDTHIPSWVMLIYALEMFMIIILWFSSLAIILSHPKITRLLEKSEKYIAKILGIFLIGFGLALVFAKQ
jgi:RhtB (resistance to homoserine/threonine) family protein